MSGRCFKQAPTSEIAETESAAALTNQRCRALSFAFFAFPADILDDIRAASRPELGGPPERGLRRTPPRGDADYRYHGHACSSFLPRSGVTV
jgi:hypothetical protein